MAKTKYLKIADGKKFGIKKFPNFHRSGSILGMKKLYYGMNALLVRCNDFVYNVSSNPEIYHKAK